MANRTRNIVLRVPVTAEERAMIERKMQQMGTGCFSVYARKMLIVHKSARVCHLHGENLPQHRRLSATSPAPLPPKSSAGNPTDRARRY